MNQEDYRNIGEQLINKLKLTTYPIAVKLSRAGEEISSNALRPKDMFGYEVPACLAYTWCRRAGMHFYLKGEDIACKPVSICYFGLEQTSDPDDVYKAWERKAAYKKNLEMEKKSRANEETLEFGEIEGLVLSPLNSTIIIPDVILIFCSPLILAHLILAATYEGDSLISHFNGMESSCKEGIIRTYKTNQCQVVVPGMGDRVMAGVQDHEMLFAIPQSKLEMVLNNLFLAGKKINPSPFGIPHLNATLGPVK
ncbi:MAG: hypothetical protein GF311_09670, partial [Candidatus Lokiarchaeota archaeon]|nr:hypothetical protein [Candidatus Lokiarchaeota archaeon]